MATRTIRLALLLVVVLAGCSSGAHAASPFTTGGAAIVPNVVGMRVCDALPVLEKAGVVPLATIASEVTWIVGSQSPAAGSHAKRDVPEALALHPADSSGPPLSRICQEAVAMSRTNG